MHLPISLLTLTLSILPTTLAVFADEAYSIDYHHALLGLPLPETTFFHRPRKDDKASLLYTLSDQGVLGAVNPGTGAIVWRQFLAANTNSTFGGSNGIKGFLRTAEGSQDVVTAVGGYVNSWDAFTGKERWHNEFEGCARDLEVLETLGDETVKDVLVLFEQAGKGLLRRLSGASGDVVWEFPIDAGDVPFQVSTDVKSVFVVSLHGVRGGYNLRVVTVDPVTGKRIEDHILATKGDVYGPEDVLLVGANMAAPIIAWTDQSKKTLKVNILNTKTIHTLNLATSAEHVVHVNIHAPHLVQSRPHFLVHCQSVNSNWADVYHVDLASSTIAEGYHLPKLPGKGTFSTSSQDANVFFTRYSDDEVTIVSSASHGVLGKYPLSVEPSTGSAIHGVSEIILKSENSYMVRSAVVTDNDNWAMIRNGATTWTRVEGLSGAIAAAWGEIPEEETLAKTLEAEAHSNPLAAYINRVNRHVLELQSLPGFLQKLPMRFLSSLFPSDNVTIPTESLARDSFGFRMLIIVATERGRIYGLDSANHGSVVWSNRAFAMRGEKWDVKDILVHANGIAIIQGSQGEQVVFHITDGKILHSTERDPSSSVQGVATVDSQGTKVQLSVGIGGHLDPLPQDMAPMDTIVVRGKLGEVNGLKYKAKGDQALPTVVWTFQPAQGLRILSVTARPAHDPVASIGRAQSDRTVMYKYLNPNNILITAVSDMDSTASFYLLDAVSGEVLYSTTHEYVDITQPIASFISENWFVYSFWSDLPSDITAPSSKGYKLIVSELYESFLANDRGPLGSAANYSALKPPSTPLENSELPYVISQSFLIPSPITHFSVSQTRQGITTRQLLCSIPASNAIIALPRNLLDPRRPVGRDPKPGEIEEGLTRYHPFIDFDPKLMITHQREVIGVKNIITTPALLESTSLVFAYGIDVFGTRVTPSLAFDLLGKGFNRLSLVATVVALAIGVGILAPMVRRKQIDGRWKTT